MYLTGFADEAAESIESQIQATTELGWQYIEARKVNGANIHDLPDAEFDIVADKLDKSGISVNCFGSTIANWGKQITDSFEISVQEVKRAIPRMQRLGTKLIRIMSYAVLADRGPQDQMAEERFRRMRELHKMFSDAGITAVHENCMNYGGMGWTFTLELLENVPGLKLVFDTGNPVSSDDMTKTAPYPKQSSWEFYSHAKEHIAYVHIKDGRWGSPGEKAIFTFPGEGDGDVRRIVKDLLDNGYDGGFSMEPHMAIVFHDEAAEKKEEQRHANYVEYGRRFMRMLKELQHPSVTND